MDGEDVQIRVEPDTAVVDAHGPPVETVAPIIDADDHASSHSDEGGEEEGEGEGEGEEAEDEEESESGEDSGSDDDDEDEGEESDKPVSAASVSVDAEDAGMRGKSKAESPSGAAGANSDPVATSSLSPVPAALATPDAGPPANTTATTTADNATINDAVAVATTTDLTAATTVAPPPAPPKPKTKRPRSPSPSPPPPPPPPLTTIRLDIALGGPEKYEVDIAAMAKATGQRPATPPMLKKRYESETENEPEVPVLPSELDVGAKPKRGRKKKNLGQEYYDLNDPFIDDSELAVDERTFFAQTKQQGFYVSSGEVALLKDKTTPKKPKSRRPLLPPPEPIAGPSNFPHPSHSSHTLSHPSHPLSHSTAYPQGSNGHTYQHANMTRTGPTHTGAPRSSLPGTTTTGTTTTGLLTRVGPQGSNTRDGVRVGVSPGSGIGTKETPIALLDDTSDDARGPPGFVSGAGAGGGGGGGAPLGVGLNGTGASAGLKRKSMDSNSNTNPNMSGSVGGGMGGSVGGGAGDVSMMSVTSQGSVGTAGGKKKRRVEIHPFHPELERKLEELRVAVAKENWDVKGKFPPGLKPLLAQVALKAITLNEYDDNFFNLMPKIFPYNRFTMSKLIKRTVFTEHTALLTERQNELLAELKKQADEGFERAREEWERSVVVWEKKQGKPTEGATSAEGTPVVQPLPSITADDNSMDVDHDTHPSSTNGGAGKDAAAPPNTAQNPPAKKYRMTDSMKNIVWSLVCLSNECCRIENEKNSLEGSTSQVSEQGLRKVLYQKIVGSFPEGWMSSGYISREVSVMKKKLEKEYEGAEG
ncbi:uncharacterized protein STEHIDRAFT_172868 [Stereum hirsutum FP-91666 SS1]|uniref:Ubinuclein middle domain-containing protein n=1 Tax=Stereum hirsutum (strain FP-91666) TaxID=721885 RepID=R7S0Z5_STEHR|nr:uncharacterized protein STEHIDRAFT_172868 [Stereum hirsutum FP-91666 SS1]EIM80227.1 hypothetical protein STEHIDRAFT_172868 [Stereum hirsutum FP-91666 SS1]